MGRDQKKNDVLHIAVAGAAGRMGQAIIAAIAENPETELIGALEGVGHPLIGEPATENVTYTDSSSAALAGADVLIEFTVPSAAIRLAELAAEAGCALVSGTTGLSAEDEETLASAAKVIPLIRARNMSIGVNILVAIAERAAAALGEDFDVEISELHHRGKRDAPSGTALWLGESVAAGRGQRLDDVRDLPRSGLSDGRLRGRIGFASLRGGSAAGDHTISFLGQGERLELTHRAESRDIFARGAVRAALWVSGRPPGSYSLKDVLGL